VAGALLAAGCSTGVAGHGRVAAGCPAVFFGVPGSGQGVHNPAPAELPGGLSAGDALSYGTTVGLLKVLVARLAGPRLASTAAVDYPAIPVNQYIGAGGLTADLDASEAQGVQVLLRLIRQAQVGSCARRPVLLSGYSQGAEVVVRTVAALSVAERSSVAVALFGNPSYQPGLHGDFPGRTTAAGIRPTFRHVAFTLPPDVRTRTIDVCAPGDPVCGVDPSLRTLLGRVSWVLHHVKIHENAYAFGVAGYAGIAAKFLWAHRVG
jgi:hypothetical protein